jgi:UDP-N-acetyl-2-amino-2-deoxyglucuronate dehydrogenase
VTEPVGVAIIGLGKWSRHLAASVKRVPSANLAICYTRTPEVRESFAAEFKCLAVSTLEAALTSPDVEAAIISAPAHVHPELTHACAEHGVHVLVEKPMALSLDEGLEMARVCEENGVVLMVGHEMRRLGSTRAMKQMVDGGKLGRVAAASAAMSLAGTFHPDNWRCHRDTNRGGALMQLGIHQIENLIYLLGPVASVTGEFANAVAPGDVDDVGIVTMAFANGARATVVSSYVSPKVYELHLYGDHANLRCEADMRVWPNAEKVDRMTNLTLHPREGEIEEISVEPQDVLALQMEDFARSIRSGHEPETGAQQGLDTLAVVEAALQSYESGAPVRPGDLYR